MNLPQALQYIFLLCLVIYVSDVTMTMVELISSFLFIDLCEFITELLIFALDIRFNYVYLYMLMECIGFFFL
jgi:hypothetical protein